MKEYIHWGHRNFDKNQFRKIENEKEWVKPIGGLWASPVDAKYGWKDWNDDNEFKHYQEDCFFKFILSNDAKVLHLYHANDLKDLPKQDSRIKSYECLDFETLSETYDAIELHLSEDKANEYDYRNNHTLYWALYGWDCDSIIITNPDIVIPEIPKGI